MKWEGLLWSPFKKRQFCSLTSPPEFTRIYYTGAQAAPLRYLCCHLHVSPWLEIAQPLLSYKLTGPSWAKPTLTNLGLIQQSNNLNTVITVLQKAYGERLTVYSSPECMDFFFFFWVLRRDSKREVMWNAFAPSEIKPLVSLKINLHLLRYWSKKADRVLRIR